MTQRTSFWSRHGSSYTDKTQKQQQTQQAAVTDSKDTRETTTHVDKRDDHTHHLSSSSHAPIIAPTAYLQTRLPPNSGSPSSVGGGAVAAAAHSSSFSSSHSSSPSPSPSINPYAGGSLRNMHPASNRPLSSSSKSGHKTLADTIAGSSNSSAGSNNTSTAAATAANINRARGLSVNTMPANIRRSETGGAYPDLATSLRQRSQHHQQSPLPPRYRSSFAGSLEDEPYLAANFGVQQQQQQQSHRPTASTRQSATSASSSAQQQASAAAATSTEKTIPQSAAAAAAAAATATATATAGHVGSRDARCEQIVQNFYSKAAHVITHLRGGRTAAHAIASSRYDQAADIDGTGSTFSPRMLAASSSGQHGAGGLPLEASSASSSVVDVGANGRRVNKWFNLNLEDISEVKEEVRFWRYAVVNAHLPLHASLPTMLIEVCLDVSRIAAGDELQVTDIFGRPWSVDLDVAAPDSRHAHGSTAGTVGAVSISDSGGRGGGAHGRGRGRGRVSTIVLEVWRLDLDTRQLPSPAPDLPRVYKQAIVFFRSLYSFASLLPAVSLGRQLQANGDGLSLFCSFRTEVTPRNGVIDLDASLTGTEKFLESHAFEPVPTPMGLFVMSVQYRRECLFTTAAQHSNPLQGSFGAIGAVDETYFTPTLSSRSGSSFSVPRQIQPQTQTQTQPQRLQTARTSLVQQTLPDTHQRGISIGSDRSLTIPSVNPFRARPLSLGESSSLPGYLAGDSTLAQRAAGRVSSEWGQQLSAGQDAGAVSTSSKTSLRRISLGARGHAHTFLGPQIASSEPVTGFSNTYDASHSDPHAGLGVGSGSGAINAVRPRSFDQKGASIAGRLSSSGGGAVDSGSMLHRSVMLRRFGDALSPTEHHRSFDNFTPVSNSATASASASTPTASRLHNPDTHLASGSKSSPKPGASSARSLSSAGSAGSVAGRSGLGFAPFKSPSLSESPKGIAGGPSSIDELAEEVLGSGSGGRRRGYTLGYEAGAGSGAALHSPSQHHHIPVGGMQQLMTKMSESPSSLGSNGSNSHSRGLSSSFGNRRTSMTRRRPSVLATPTAAAESVRGHGTDELSGLTRRHTIVEGRRWNTNAARPAAAEGQMDDEQDIDNFIRMVDTKQPLRMYKRKESSQSTRQAGMSTASSANRRSATFNAPLSAGTTALHTRPGVLGTSPPPSTTTARPRVPSSGYHQRSSEPLQMYYGVLHEFNGLSQHMQSSVIIAPASVPADGSDIDAAVAGGQSSSPFRTRQAIPNPLRSNERLSIGVSRPPSMMAAPTSGLSYSSEKAGSVDAAANVDTAASANHTTPASKAGSKPLDDQHTGDSGDGRHQQDQVQMKAPSQSADAQSQGRSREQTDHEPDKAGLSEENGQSFATLQQAFSGLFIDSQHDHRSESQTSTTALAPVASRAHIRSAAPGLDAELERPLPQPVSISYLPSEATTRYTTRQQKQQQQQQKRQRHQLVRRENEDLDMRMSDVDILSSGSAAFVRGKSQPVSYVPELDTAFVPRMTTPQPPLVRYQSPVQASMPNAKLRLSPDSSGGPLSHRSDFISSNHQLGALLGIADDAAGSNPSPRSTPSTPMQQQNTAVLGPGGGRFGRQRAASSMVQRQQQQHRQVDPLRSNFPPLSFIVPRSRMEVPSRSSSPAASVSGIDRGIVRRSSSSLLLPEDRDYTDDEDMMFQMDASVN